VAGLEQQALHVGEQLVHRHAVGREQAQAALAVEHVATGDVAHGVGIRYLAGFLFVERLEVAGHRGQLRFVADQRDCLGVERFHIGARNLRRVAGRVDADEHHLQLVGILAHQVLDLAQLDHRGRAHVRAAGEAEEQIGHLPCRSFGPRTVPWLSGIDHCWPSSSQAMSLE
jgi:hypothetical protein